METSEYETNALLINNISSINFEVYEQPSDQTFNFPSLAIELESSLRQDGHLVFYDTNKKSIWCFTLQFKDAGHGSKIVSKDGSSAENTGFATKLCNHNLVMTESGVLDPSTIQKIRSAGPSMIQNTPTTPSSATSLDHPHRSTFVFTGQNSAQTPSSQKYNGMQKVAYENFIAAILLALITAFCPAMGAIPLNYRTVLLPPDLKGGKGFGGTKSSYDTVIGTFGAYLTMTGYLVITLGLNCCQGLLPLDNPFAASPGQSILAAPFGIQSPNHSSTGEPGTASLAQTPTTAMSFRGVPDIHGGLWRQACIRVLKLRGIPASTLEGCSWVNVTVARRRLQESRQDSSRSRDAASTAVIPWPGSLCFRQRAIEASTTSRIGDTILSGQDENRDPLGGAGRWLNLAADRDDQMSRRKGERAAQTSTNIDSIASRPDMVDASVSLNPGRPNPTIAGIMYPTPPDVIQHPHGITPTFDGATSSPRTMPSAHGTVSMDADETMNSGVNINNPDGDDWDNKREQSLSDAENLVVGDDMFGDDNDITEADFNFFDDEQPGDAMMGLTPMFQPSPGLAHAPQGPVLSKPGTPKMETSKSFHSQPLPSLEDSHVFTKPQLKHARSLLNDSQTIRPANEKQTVPSKRESSPFDSKTVFKRIKASFPPTIIQPLTATTSNVRKRRTSCFEKIDLGSTLPMINRKYERGGSFDFAPTALEVNKNEGQLGSLPETNYLKRHGKNNKKPKPQTLPVGSLLKRFTEIDGSTSQTSPLKFVTSPSDDDLSSVESDQDDSSYTSEDQMSPMKVNFRRATIDEDVTSQVTSLRDNDPIDEPDQRLAMELPRLSKPEHPEVSLSRFFLDPEPLTLELNLTDKDTIQIAQILTEQAALGTLHVIDWQQDKTSVHANGCRDTYQQLSNRSRDTLRALRSVIPASMTSAQPGHLKALLDIPDLHVPTPPPRMQPRPIPGRDPNPDLKRPNSIWHIPYHHLEVRKSETRISVLPSAISFWESLGLGPSSGSKDVQALCVFPGWSGMADNVQVFVERMKSFYELLKLGTFNKLSLSTDHEDGLLPYEVDKISTAPDASVTRQGSTLIESMDVLQSALWDSNAAGSNLVIFMVYIPSNPGTIVEACLAFQRFFESYQKLLASRREQPQNELVLQLISLDMISSPTTLVMTTPSELMKLCIETYDRCTLFNGPMPAPAITLEQQVPRWLDFKNTKEPSASLMHENSCIHVAYARSIDDRWVSAAWTDDRGIQQATMSYCLGRKGRPLSTTMNEVAHEIWESTLDIIGHRKVHWRIIITKSGPMDPYEIDFWSGLSRTESKMNVALVLMTVNTNPSLQLIPPAAQIPHSATGFYTTPVSTPQPNVLSPDTNTTPATPILNMTSVATPVAEINTSEVEADAALLDLTDQTWGAVLGHRLSNSTTILELQPALVSGYLITRTSPRLEDAPSVMEVNLIHTESTPRAYEPLFREMLASFRGLGTLARARGIVGGDVRPWHIAAAEKAVRVLNLLM